MKSDEITQDACIEKEVTTQRVLSMVNACLAGGKLRTSMTIHGLSFTHHGDGNLRWILTETKHVA